MWSELSFLLHTATGLKRAHETSICLQSVSKLIKLQQLASILQTIPLVGPAFKPLARLLPNKLKSPVTSNIIPNEDTTDGLSDIASIFATTDSISRAVLRTGNSTILQNEAAYFLHNVIPVLNGFQFVAEMSGIYMVVCFVVNTLFFIRKAKEGERPIVFSFTTFRDRIVIYVPYALLKPSYKLTIVYRWYKLLLAFICICLISLGPEFLSLTIFSGIRGISALDLQLALSHLMLKNKASPSLLTLSGTLFSQFLSAEQKPVGLFRRVRNWSKWILGIGVPLLAVAKKIPTGGSDSEPASETLKPFEQGGPHPDIAVATPATATATTPATATAATAPSATPVAEQVVPTPRPPSRTRGRMAEIVTEPPVVEQIVPPEARPLGFDETYGTGPESEPLDPSYYL